MSVPPLQRLFGFNKNSPSKPSAPAAVDPEDPAAQPEGGGPESAGEGVAAGNMPQSSSSPRPAPTGPAPMETTGDIESSVPSEPAVRFASSDLAVVISPQGEAPGPAAEDEDVQVVGSALAPQYAKHSALNTTPYGPAHSWCRRCVRMVAREPQSAGTDYVCSRREHVPCRYCTRGARQGCEEIFPPWFELTDDILSTYRRWAEAPEAARPAIAARLKRYGNTFNQVARDCNLPDAPPKPDRRRRNVPRTSSRAASRAPPGSPSRDRSRSPRSVGSPVQRRSRSPLRARSGRSPARPARVPSSEVHDNHAELVQIVERLMEEARVERMEGPNVGNQATFWGVTRQFFRNQFRS